MIKTGFYHSDVRSRKKVELLKALKDKESESVNPT